MSDDELVRRYLLGDLPGDEMEELEKRLLSEDDLFELAEAVEADVLDDYARGELEPAQRERVESYLDVSAGGRMRLAVIRGLAAERVPGRLLSFPPRLPEELAVPWVRAAALAAMLVVTVSTLLLVQQTTLPFGKMANHLNAEAFVATIPLAQLRGAVQVPSFDIPPAGPVELRLPLPPHDENFSSYSVALTDAGGREVKKEEDLEADPGTHQIILHVDAEQLPTGRYSLVLQGVTPEGQAEDLAFPEFEVYEP